MEQMRAKGNLKIGEQSAADFLYWNDLRIERFGGRTIDAAQSVARLSPH